MLAFAPSTFARVSHALDKDLGLESFVGEPSHQLNTITFSSPSSAHFSLLLMLKLSSSTLTLFLLPIRRPAIGILSGKKEKIGNNKLQEQNAFISTINHGDGNNRGEGREGEDAGKWRERQRARCGANSLLVDLRSIESVSHHHDMTRRENQSCC